MPSSSRRRRRRRRKKRPSPGSEARDWAALPRDILVDVFLRLGSCGEIMRGAERTCTAWRRVAVDEPLLWRRIDIAEDRWWTSSRGAMAVRAAVDRSAGQCEAFSGIVDDESLLYLVERAPLLKILRLCIDDIDNEIFNVALKKLTLLESVPYSVPYSYMENLFESVGQACPHLKKLRLTLPNIMCYASDEEMEIHDGGMCEIPVMCKLSSLELFEFYLTTDGLTAILDNCPLLESLHITGFFMDKEMDEELRAKCARVKNISLPVNDDEEYYYDEYREEPWGTYSDDEFY